MRRIAWAIFALLSAVSPLAAACAPEQLAAAIDRYASDPFSVRTWRVLKGLSDPGIKPDAACFKDYSGKVLDQHLRIFGPDHPYIQQWLSVQSAVQAACNGELVSELPPPREFTGALALAQTADRDFQQAALVFETDRAKALPLFRAIASSASPHRAFARYRVAWLLTFAQNAGEARREVDAILADSSLAQVHGATKALVPYILLIGDTAKVWQGFFREAAAAVDAPQLDPAAYRRAQEAMAGLGQFRDPPDVWEDGRRLEMVTITGSLARATKDAPLAQWLIAGQAAQAYRTASAWHATAGETVPDVVGAQLDRAVALIEPASPLAAEALRALQEKPSEALWPRTKAAAAAAETTCGTAPDTALAGLLLHNAARISAQAGAYAEAIDGLTAFPAKSSTAYATAVRELGRVLLARNAMEQGRDYRDRLLTPEFLAALPADKSAGLVALAMGFARDNTEYEADLARHPAKTRLAELNLLSIAKLRDYARYPTLFSAVERAQLIRAAWARAFALGQIPDKRFTNELYIFNPEIRAIFDRIGIEYPKISPEHRLLLTVLRSPRLNTVIAPGEDAATALDSFQRNDRNWWCPLELDRHLAAVRADFDRLAGAGPQSQREAVLKAGLAERGVKWDELAALAKAPGAPELLTTRAITWAKASKGADGAPEALALAIRVTQYGCNRHGSHEAYSRGAYELLQAKFGATAWAAQTPRWYGCMRTGLPAGDTACTAERWPGQELLK